MSGDANGGTRGVPGGSVVAGLEDERSRSALSRRPLLPLPHRTRDRHGRYGLYGNEPRKLQDIAEGLGLSCERVRQLQRRAPKMRRSG